MSRARRVILGLTALIVVGAAVFAALSWAEGEARARVVEAARRRGITATLGDVELPLFGGLALSDVRLSAAGVPLAELARVETDLGLLEVALGARRPARVRLVGGSLAVAFGPDGPRGWGALEGAREEPTGEPDGEAEPLEVALSQVTVWLEGGVEVAGVSDLVARLVGQSAASEPSRPSGPSSGSAPGSSGASGPSVALAEPVAAVVTGTVLRDASRKLSASLEVSVRQGAETGAARIQLDPDGGLAITVPPRPDGARPALRLTLAGEAASVRVAALALSPGVASREADQPGVVGPASLAGRVEGAELRLGPRRVALGRAEVSYAPEALPVGPAPAGTPVSEGSHGQDRGRLALALADLELSEGLVSPWGLPLASTVASLKVTLTSPRARLASGAIAGGLSGLSVESPRVVLRLPEGTVPALGASPSGLAAPAPSSPEAGVSARGGPPEEDDAVPFDRQTPADDGSPSRASTASPEAARDTAGTFTFIDAVMGRLGAAPGRVAELLGEGRMAGLRELAASAPRVGGLQLVAIAPDGREMLRLEEGHLRLEQGEAGQSSGSAPGSSGRLRVELGASLRREAVELAHVAIGATLVDAAAGGRVDEAHLRLKGTELAGRLAALVPQLRVEPASAVDLDVRWTPSATPGTPQHIAGSFAFSDLTFQHWRISDQEIRGLRGVLDFEAALDPDGGRVLLSLPRIALGGATLYGDVEVRKRPGDRPAFRFHLGMAPQDCGVAADAIPRSLLPNLSTLALRGEMAFDARLDVDFARPRELKLAVDGDLAGCEVLSLGPGLDLEALRGDFVHHPREPERGELSHIAVGRGTPSWVSSSALPEHVKLTAYMTEDGSFHTHKGVSWGLVAGALRLDFEHGRFVYGGSTITQQLVKNLFLTRRKNLGRKFEEAIIAWQLERVLTKDEILTLYINCIEYGPDIYGFRAAARHYFGKLPHEIDPLEAAFIMGLKPFPKAGYRQWVAGHLDPWWVRRVSHIVRMVARNRSQVVSPQEAEAFAPFQPVFRRPGEDRPAAAGGETDAEPAGDPAGLPPEGPPEGGPRPPEEGPSTPAPSPPEGVP